MHRYLLIIIAVLLAGCQDFGAAGQKSHSSAPADTGAIDRLASALNADYDNHEQVAHAQASAQADCRPPATVRTGRSGFTG